MVTINDIAKRAGVSRTTVSRVINNSGYVSEASKRRIMTAIEETGYVPSEQAKSLRLKRTKVIGVILPKISTETSSRVVDGINSELNSNGYQILLASSDLSMEREIEHLKLLQSRRVDGIILVATNREQPLLNAIHQAEVPVVVLGQDIKGNSSVLYDDYHAAKAVMNAIFAKGHKKIGFIGVHEQDQAVGVERKQAYLDAMAESGVTIEEGWMQEAIFDIDSGATATKQMMQSLVKPTAIFAVTDRLAIGAMQYLQANGLKIPEDIAIIGIGASDLSKYVTPSLSTVDYFHEEAGILSARLLLNNLQNGEKKVEKSLMRYRLIERNSLV
ncbi:LacI family DNA-binding transcriptional regulator [Paenalkalicoccus suaedae]|uniref:LacI family DNA-binding transcriptional regulator n=1 Tax=Paenalkalicoccus suaedae TaxID=2592382 RepID=A0A859FD74_9BACI|nr:LacI family DNA-binding transcriptional regulator [Paenalkalicoccus suaedae]QKS70166.1 LacI family DNA-binding transcriptional regulator [Paenalkalicoccus suaedae]